MDDSRKEQFKYSYSYTNDEANSEIPHSNAVRVTTTVEEETTPEGVRVIRKKEESQQFSKVTKVETVTRVQRHIIDPETGELINEENPRYHELLNNCSPTALVRHQSYLSSRTSTFAGSDFTENNDDAVVPSTSSNDENIAWPENTKVNRDEEFINYDPYDQNLVDEPDFNVDNAYEGLGGVVVNPTLRCSTTDCTKCCVGWRDPELPEVIDFLNHPSDAIKENAAAYLQHLCYNDDNKKQQIRLFGGILPLILLLRHENPAIRKNACGALRNLCYGKNNDEIKLEVKRVGGISTLSGLIHLTPYDDLKETACAVLWNLSSCDELKITILQECLYAIVQSIILPYSGWHDDIHQRRNPQGIFPSCFKNATGILRNCSSAGLKARQMLRDCDGLIPALIHAMNSALCSNEMDNKSIENCLGILQNLSYRLQEVVETNSIAVRGDSVDNAFLKKRESRGKNSLERSSIIPCEGGKHVELLWQPDIIPPYVTILRDSGNPDILESAAGCIQNLTACSWKPSAELRIEVRRAKGLHVLVELLRALEFDRVVGACAIALRNLAVDSKNRELIGQYGMSDLINILPQSQHVSDGGCVHRQSNHTLAAALAAINELVKSNENNVRICVLAGGVERMMGIVKSKFLYSPKVVRYAMHVLYVLWRFKSLHDLYKKKGFKEIDFMCYKISSVLGPSSPQDTLLRPRGNLCRNQSSGSSKPLLRGRLLDSKRCMHSDEKANGSSSNADSTDKQSVLYATVNKVKNGNAVVVKNQSSIVDADSWV